MGRGDSALLVICYEGGRAQGAAGGCGGVAGREGAGNSYLTLTLAEALPPRLLVTVMFTGLAMRLKLAL